jgi:Fe-Mn family superoxide dismutase
MKNVFKLEDYEQWQPYLTKQLVDCHYNMHHMQYVKRLIASGVNEYMDVLKDPYSYTTSQMNNALQIYNHNLFWQSMKLNTTAFDVNIDEFKKNANSIFGSGWTWLVQNKITKQIISINTKDAEKPSDQYVILACLDLWEHAYYVQYFGDRSKFIEIFCTYLLNYDFIKSNMLSD